MENWPTFSVLLGRDSSESQHQKGSRVNYLAPSNSSDSDSASLHYKSSPSSLTSSISQSDTTTSITSPEDIASLVRETLDPWCRLAHTRLNRVIVNDCDLWYHLSAIENLFFMRRDATTRFCETLFEQVSMLSVFVIAVVPLKKVQLTVRRSD